MRSPNHRRRYRLGRRAEQAAATRRRIVEATLEVHDEQGIARTSVRNVAARAGVSPATVLNHFPRMGDLIQACGELSSTLLPMPTSGVLLGARNRGEAVRLLARAFFTWWEQLGASWDHLQVDRRTLPAVDEWLNDVEARRRALVVEAAGADADAAVVAVLVALTSRGSWISLRESGLDIDRAAAEVARTFLRTARGMH